MPGNIHDFILHRHLCEVPQWCVAPCGCLINNGTSFWAEWPLPAWGEAPSGGGVMGPLRGDCGSEPSCPLRVGLPLGLVSAPTHRCIHRWAFLVPKEPRGSSCQNCRSLFKVIWGRALVSGGMAIW